MAQLRVEEQKKQDEAMMAELRAQEQRKYEMMAAQKSGPTEEEQQRAMYEHYL